MRCWRCGECEECWSPIPASTHTCVAAICPWRLLRCARCATCPAHLTPPSAVPRRSKDTSQPPPAGIMLHQLRKVYPPRGNRGSKQKVAVADLSLAIQPDECFGLVGGWQQGWRGVLVVRLGSRNWLGRGGRAGRRTAGCWLGACCFPPGTAPCRGLWCSRGPTPHEYGQLETSFLRQACGLLGV